MIHSARPFSFDLMNQTRLEKGLGFEGVTGTNGMSTNSSALALNVGGRKLNITGQAFGVG